jgi:hypothetical protein
MLKPVDAINTFGQYFKTLDDAFDSLSNLEEGKIVKLPSYVFGKRHIAIFRLGYTKFYLIKVVVDLSLDSDKGFTGQLNSNEEIKKATYPLEFDFNLNQVPEEYGMVIDRINIKEVGNPNALPVIDDQMLSIVREDRFFDWFSVEKAKERALDIWNKSDTGIDNNYTFVHNLKNIFDKLSAIVKRKSFLERRVHRFINSHATYILPSFLNCYYEFPIVYGEEKRVADFIIERETGFPALLIELESPSQPVFKKNNELTHQSHHAVSQINEWKMFIDQDSRNTQNEMKFLSGPKDKVIIIGRGIENLEAMKNSKFSGTAVWTYDLLISEAKKRWNLVIKEQSKAIGIEEPNLLN